MTSSGKRVPISPVLIQAAKLRKTINDRRGMQTSPVTEKIAALEYGSHQLMPAVDGAAANGAPINGSARPRVDGTAITKVNGTAA